MDSRKRQTSTVTPAQPGDFPLWFKKDSAEFGATGPDGKKRQDELAHEA